MGKFIRILFYSLVVFFLFFEGVLRVLDIAGSTSPEKNIDGDMLFLPGATGEFIRGGMGEIRTTYSINSQGWNSLIDYAAPIDSSKYKIALIGDSYIEGFHADVNKSIGRKIEELFDHKCVVHEFGHSGGNILDYIQISEKYNLASYDFVFILISDNDLKAKSTSFMGKGQEVPESLMRTIYNYSYVLRYLNINRGLNTAIKNLISGKSSASEHDPSVRSNELSDTERHRLLEFAENTNFIYEEGNIGEKTLMLLQGRTVKIDHINRPYNFGFDRHWNDNGRWNCANSVVEFLKYKSKIQ